MEGLEAVVVIGITVFIGAVLAPRVRVAAPLLLLVGGLLLGFVPQLREIQLPPETVLLIFLPVMLFWESLTTSLRSIRRDFRGIVLLSTILVVATAFAVAIVAHLLGLPWNAALLLGAALAPPDATAVAALGRMLPRRNFMLLKAESLTNDGTALVIYAIAIGVTAGGAYTPWDITGLVLLSYVGGAVAGSAVAGLAFLTMRRLTDAFAINLALLITPFTAFLVAELIGASGVLAVVVAGLLVAFTSSRISTASSRRQTESAWPLGSYVLNGALFVLIGLEVQVVTREIHLDDIPRLLLTTVAVWVTLMIVRFGFQTLSITLIRLLDRRPSQRGRRMTYRARVVSSVSGFRGAVSLAIALSVPMTLKNGDALPGRDDILFITAGVIVLTLLVQGPMLPMVVRWAQLPADSDDEQRLAQRAITGAALAALAEMDSLNPGVRQRLHEEYQAQLDLVDMPVDRQQDSTGAREYTNAKLSILARKREVLVRLRQDGTIDDAVARGLQTRLDVEEQRLIGADPVD